MLKRLWPWFVLVLVLVFVYWPVLSEAPRLKRDDQWVLEHIKSPSEIAERMMSGEWVAPLVHQPLRDASLIVDQWLSGALGVSTFHATQLGIWLVLLFGIQSLLSVAVPEATPRARQIWVALFALHPVFVGSVGWLSARKHLLAAAFVCFATVAWLNRKPARAFVLYAASLLAHPIGVLWPAWALMQKKLQRESMRSSRPWIIAALVFGGLLAVVSWRHYGATYVDYLGVQKYVEQEAPTTAAALLAHGRYMFNLVFPVMLSPVYRPASWMNVAGLFLLLVLFIALLRRPDRGRATIWTAFYLFPLLVVTARMTNVFVSDTYLVIASMGAWILAASAVERISNRRAVRVVQVLLCVAFTMLSRSQAKAWTSDLSLWELAWSREPSPRVASVYATELIENGRFQEAAQVAGQWIDWEPAQADGYALATSAVYLDRSLSLDARADAIGRISKWEAGRGWASYYLGLLAYENGDPAAAFAYHLTALERCKSLGRAAGRVAGDMLSTCRAVIKTRQKCDSLELLVSRQCPMIQ